jgi:predicted nucleotidyltransferase
MARVSHPQVPDSTRTAVPPQILEALRTLKSWLSSRFGGRLQQMRLFGSVARGTAHSGSDVDVCVLIEDLTAPERASIYEQAGELALDLRVRLAPLALSTAEYRELSSLERMLALDIEREGLAL